MTTGDVKNNLKKLHAELKSVKYEKDIDYDSLSKGVPSAFLLIYDYIFNNYNCYVTEEISKNSLELVGKSDLRFIEAMYKILRVLYGYNPLITKEQFFHHGFGERKVIMCSEIISKVRQRRMELAPKTRKKVPSAQSGITMVKRKAVTQTVDCGSNKQKLEDSKLGDVKSYFEKDNTITSNVSHIDKQSIENPAYHVLKHAYDMQQLFDSEDSDVAVNPVANANTSGDNREPLKDELNEMTSEVQPQLLLSVFNTVQEKVSTLVGQMSNIENRLLTIEKQISGLNVQGMETENLSSRQSVENLTARITLLENSISLMKEQFNLSSNSIPLHSAKAQSSTSTDTIYSETSSKWINNAAFYEEKTDETVEKENKNANLREVDDVCKSISEDGDQTVEKSGNQSDSITGDFDTKLTTSTPATQIQRIKEMLNNTENMLTSNEPSPIQKVI